MARIEGRPALTELDAPITEEEVIEALNGLKLGKAADAMGVSAELLRGRGELAGQGDDRVPSVARVLTPILQGFFTSGLPPQLSTATLMPLYKGKGDTNSMDNYRGIALMSIVAKLYASILTSRLTKTLEQHGLRSDLQFGFRPKRSTVDAAFVLQTIADKYAAGEARPVYVAFVDFAKAFDMMSRDRLWARLEDLGVRGAFLRAVQLYYGSVLFQVNTGEQGLSEAFEAASGVKQGCPLSPALFGCFIEGLAETLAQEAAADPDAPQLGQQHVPAVLFADDTTLISLSKRGLQRLLDRLAAFCSAQGMKVNEAKTKITVLRKGDKAPKDASQLRYNGTPLALVEEFKFLGIPLHGDLRRGPDYTLETLAKSGCKTSCTFWCVFSVSMFLGC